MDDLDRLAFRVARTLRTTYPQLLEHGFTLSDVEERLAPFPEARRELAASGQDGYELTLLRLLSGERGYLAADSALQEAARRALGADSPAVSLVRTWVGSPLSLRQPAHTLGQQGGRSGSGAAADAGTPAARRHSLRVATAGHPAEAPPPPDSATAEPCGCQFCGGTLPTGRSLTFCPYCGLNLTIRYCPACSSELEREWQFCVTCGRQADAIASGPLPASSPASRTDAAESPAHRSGSSRLTTPNAPASEMSLHPSNRSARETDLHSAPSNVPSAVLPS